MPRRSASAPARCGSPTSCCWSAGSRFLDGFGGFLFDLWSIRQPEWVAFCSMPSAMGFLGPGATTGFTRSNMTATGRSSSSTKRRQGILSGCRQDDTHSVARAGAPFLPTPACFQPPHGPAPAAVFVAVDHCGRSLTGRFATHVANLMVRLRREQLTTHGFPDDALLIATFCSRHGKAAWRP